MNTFNDLYLDEKSKAKLGRTKTESKTLTIEISIKEITLFTKKSSTYGKLHEKEYNFLVLRTYLPVAEFNRRKQSQYCCILYLLFFVKNC